jgi:hypothetical protein
VSLYQVVFEYKGFFFGIGDEILEVGYIFHQPLSLIVMFLRGCEIGFYPVVQIVRFAHVYDGATGVLEYINSRTRRQVFQLFGNNAFGQSLIPCLQVNYSSFIQIEGSEAGLSV